MRKLMLRGNENLSMTAHIGYDEARFEPRTSDV